MSIFNYLQKFNISVGKIPLLTEDEIKNFGKRLKAEQKINAVIDQNEIEKCLHILKHNRNELIGLFQPKYAILKQILTSPKTFCTAKPERRFFKREEDVNMPDLLARQFNVELLEHVDQCFSGGYYNSLYYLLGYIELLTPELIAEVVKKMHVKIDYAIEVSKLQQPARREKIEYISNPFFYKSLTLLGTSQFEDAFLELLLSSFNLNPDDPYNILVGFSMYEFDSQRADVKTQLSKFKSAADYHDIQEVTINTYTKKPTGGASRWTRTEEADKTRGCFWSIRIAIAVIVIFVAFFRECKKDEAARDALTITSNQNTKWETQTSYFSGIETNL